MNQYDQARAWRVRRALSVDALAELTGYSRESIYQFERGTANGGRNTPSPRPVPADAWQRYRMCCAGVEAGLGGKKFRW